MARKLLMPLCDQVYFQGVLVVVSDKLPKYLPADSCRGIFSCMGKDMRVNNSFFS